MLHATSLRNLGEVRGGSTASMLTIRRLISPEFLIVPQLSDGGFLLPDWFP